MRPAVVRGVSAPVDLDQVHSKWALATREPSGWSGRGTCTAVRPGNFQSTRYRRQTVLPARPVTPPEVGDCLPWLWATANALHAHEATGGSRSDSPRCAGLLRGRWRGQRAREPGQATAGGGAVLGDRTPRTPSLPPAVGWLLRSLGGGLGGIPAFQMYSFGRRPSRRVSAGGGTRRGLALQGVSPLRIIPPAKGTVAATRPW